VSGTVSFELACPRCGRGFAGEDKDEVADAVIAHATGEHRHELDREIVLAHLEGVRPDER
jgi:hypothetical protein